jgi:hypothetical protein
MLLPPLRTFTRRQPLRVLGVVAAFVLGAAFACSAETTPRGQLMLALQSDMSLPKDVSRIRIQVLQAGAFKFDQTYPVGGPTDAKIPATLGIVDDDTGEPVEVRVLGFRGDEVRTLNKTITTVPGDRVALLRMPIQWLCEGMARDIGGDTFESTCPAAEDGQEMACVAGTCQPVAKDSGEFPDFEPAAVFGGGDGRSGNGSCFTTESCFDDGFDVTPDMGSCTVEIMAGENEPLNFGLRTAQTTGDGICSGQNCYVPLDNNDEFGWRDPQAAQAGQSGREPGGDPGPMVLRNIELPGGVCSRIADGRAVGLRASKSCATKTSDVPPCGPWSSVGGSVGGDADGGAMGPAECPGFVAGQTIPLTGEPMVDDYLRAASDLKALAEQLKGIAGVACANTVTALGGQTNINMPPLDPQLQVVCEDAVNLLLEHGAADHPALRSPGVCMADIAGQLSCEEACADAACGPAEQRCQLGTGSCSGLCSGFCVGAMGMPVDCNGNCSARCSGTCDGMCAGAIGGACDGKCEGICTGSCDGMCTVKFEACTGICKGDPGNVMACEGGFEGSDSCGLPLQPESCGDTPCAELCAAQAGIGQTCTPSAGGIGASAPADLAQAVNANSGPLQDVMIQVDALVDSAGYLDFAGATLMEGAGDVIGCLQAGSMAIQEARTTLDITRSAVAPVVEFRVGAGNDAGTALDAGTLPDGGGADCFPAGGNPLIDDFEDGDYMMPPNDGRDGAWSFAVDPSGSLDSGINEIFPMARGASTRGLHVMATGATDWGAGIISPFTFGGCYDVSTWGGLSFWSKAPAAITLSVRVWTMDSVTACTPSMGSNCSFYAEVAAGTTWTQHQLSWTMFNQWDGSKPAPSFDPSMVLGVEILQPASAVDFLIDDIGFQ